MSAAAILGEMARRDNIVDIFGRVLARHGIVLAINRMDFHLCKTVIVGYGMARPSENIEYDVSSLKEEEPDHDDFDTWHRHRKEQLQRCRS